MFCYRHLVHFQFALNALVLKRRIVKALLKNLVPVPVVVQASIWRVRRQVRNYRRFLPKAVGGSVRIAARAMRAEIRMCRRAFFVVADVISRTIWVVLTHRRNVSRSVRGGVSIVWAIMNGAKSQTCKVVLERRLVRSERRIRSKWKNQIILSFLLLKKLRYIVKNASHDWILKIQVYLYLFVNKTYWTTDLCWAKKILFYLIYSSRRCSLLLTRLNCSVSRNIPVHILFIRLLLYAIAINSLVGK